MRKSYLRLALVPMVLLQFACGSSSTSPGAAANRAPTADAPAFVDVREGERVTFEVNVADADKDVVAFEALGSSDIRVAVVAKANAAGSYQLTVDALFDSGPHTISLTLGDGKEIRKLDIDVRIARMKWGSTWELAAGGVAEREHPAVIFDAARDRILVLGGSGYKPQGTPLSDAHQVSTKTGKPTPLQLEGATLPAIASMRVAQVPGTQTAYLFGGYGVDANGANKLYSDMYRADFAGDTLNLTRLEQTAGPVARSLHGMTYDEVSKRIFVFAGIDQNNAILGDLWVGTVAGDQVSWTAKTLAEKPSKRYGFFFGQIDGKTLIFSGAQGTSSVKPARDLWALDTRAPEPSYVKLLDGDAVPEGRRNGCFAVDRIRNRLFVFGGTPDAKSTLAGLWVYDARTNTGLFSELARGAGPAIRSSGSGIVDERDGSAFFGMGNDDNIYSDFTRFGF
jgi:hypothetical protein